MVYIIYYKWMITTLKSQALITSPKIHTILLQHKHTQLNHTNP
jgi:hypothetical protein